MDSETAAHPEKKEKPEFLFHGSPNRSLILINPQNLHTRDHKEGPVVFGTPSEDFASMFLARTDDRWARKGIINGVWYQLIIDRQKFANIDLGGSIYVLPSDTFDYDPQKGMRHNEWSSKISVKPLRKTDYESGLTAMIDHGVQVYFTDKATFEQAKELRGREYTAFLKGLQSENQRIGKNAIDIPLFTIINH